MAFRLTGGVGPLPDPSNGLGLGERRNILVGLTSRVKRVHAREKDAERSLVSFLAEVDRERKTHSWARCQQKDTRAV